MRALILSSINLYYLLLFCCLASRIFSGIYYIEDIDSLRFALSISDSYNLSKFQPHFPGYPVFCFVSYILYTLLNNLGLTFSIIGGLSTFTIIYYSIKIMDLKIKSSNSLFLILIIFFNPMIWILGNRYMPDLMGLAVSIASMYYLIYSQKDINNYKGFFLGGILLGIRLSYFPLLIIPFGIFLYKNQKVFYSLLFFLIGILIWLFPLITTQGYYNLIALGYKHSAGHFYDYGGTVLTDSNMLLRIKFLFHTVWSDGLGGYWIDRNWITLFISIYILNLLKNILTKHKFMFDTNLKIIIFSSILYLVWIYFFQNLIYKSRHVLPLVYILLLLMSLGHNNMRKHLVNYGLIIFLSILTINLVIGHKTGTSISFLNKFLKNENTDYVISNPLINYYLKSNGIKSNFINVENNNLSQFHPKIEPNKNIKVIGDYSDLFINKNELLLDTILYHNPYINRMWSTIPIYSVE